MQNVPCRRIVHICSEVCCQLGDRWPLQYYLLYVMLVKQHLLLIGKVAWQLIQMFLMDGEPIYLLQCLTCRDITCIHVVLHFILHMTILHDTHYSPVLALSDILIQILHSLHRVHHLYINVCLIAQR